MTEQLTYEERNGLLALDQAKALRIIDDLTRERDEARANVGFVGEALTAAESEVTRLTDELKAAERDVKFWTSKCDQLVERVKAAEARVRELEAALAACANAQPFERFTSALSAANDRAEAAEAEAKELTERVSQALTGLRPGSPVREALEEALRAP